MSYFFSSSGFMNVMTWAGTIGHAEIAVLILGLLGLVIWFIYTTSERSLPTIVWAAWLGMATLLATVVTHLGIDQVSHAASISSADNIPPMIEAIRQAVSVQALLGLFIPVVCLFQFLGSVTAIRSTDKAQLNALVTIGISIPMGVLLFKTARHETDQIAAIGIGLFVFFSALTQMHNGQNAHSAERRFSHALLISIGVCSTIVTLKAYDYLDFFDAVASINIENQPLLLEHGASYVAKLDMPYMLVMLLSTLPAVLSVFSLSGFRLMLGGLTLSAIGIIVALQFYIFDVTGAIVILFTQVPT